METTMDHMHTDIQLSAFREYDIRALVETEMPVTGVYDLARAIIAYFVKQDPRVQSIAVGMDGRTHSPAIAEQVCKACIDSGIDVHFLGLCPTPVLYYSLHTCDVQAGIMVTASHNPKEYNGLKLCLGTECLWGNDIRAIRALYQERASHTTGRRGERHNTPLISKYVDSLVNHFEHLRGMQCSAIVDCGNGTAGTIWPLLIKELALRDICLLYPDVDGTFPHHESDPTVAHNMIDLKNTLARTAYQLGLGFDGDCDRVAPMTKDGQLVPGDKMIGVFTKQILKKHPNACVVCDIKSSSIILKILGQWGARPVMTRTGYAIIRGTMKSEHALLGGEVSCHFTFKDRHLGFDDGFYAALRLLEILYQNKSRLEDELAVFPQLHASPEIRIACPEQTAKKIITELQTHLASRAQYRLNTLDGIRLTTPDGWGIIRPSNTQPVLSLRFESETATGLERLRQTFNELLTPYFEKDALQQALGR